LGHPVYPLSTLSSLVAVVVVVIMLVAVLVVIVILFQGKHRVVELQQKAHYLLHLIHHLL
jgi:hypothetical protein